LIVGAGIAGLALARALLKRGFDPEIVERADRFTPVGTGIYIPANGYRALEKLGLADGLLARAVRMSHQRIFDHQARLLAEVELARVWSAVGPCVGIRRADLHAMLLEGSIDVPILLGTTVVGVSQTPHAATVTFDDGQTREYEIVVGADGIRSSIRTLVFGEIAPRYVGQISWRFLTRNTAGVTTWTAMLARDRAFLMLPVGSDGLYCYADLVSRSQEDCTVRDARRLRAIFADFAEPVPSLLHKIGRADIVHFAPIEEVHTDPWVKGRVVLIGDAAHATSPNMAEGASMALEDAVVLGEMLGRDRSSSDGLAAFAQRRRARVEWVRTRTHRRDRIRSLPVFLRNLALRAAGATIYKQDYRPLFDEP
jgi:2-polyprenyl-6-methoxyphenol hydroxylase-like FAD-dependent oxidoreductase